MDSTSTSYPETFCAARDLDPSYMFSGNNLEQEWQRLDAQHAGFLHYLKGELTMAPLHNPTKILDMGAGNGAWAAQAAQLYPAADVLAVDISPLPRRNFPSNLTFQQLNLLDDFPWENETFDVIHMRLLLYHIPHAADFINRAIDLLQPNGYIIIEDCCLLVFPCSSGPALRMRNEITSSFLLNKGLDPEIGSHIEDILKESDSLQDISVHQELMCFTPLTDDPAIRPLSETMRNSVIRTTTRSPSAELVRAGMTPELRIEWEKEMNDPRYDPTHRFFFVWGRKCSHI